MFVQYKGKASPMFMSSDKKKEKYVLRKYT